MLAYWYFFFLKLQYKTTLGDYYGNSHITYDNALYSLGNVLIALWCSTPGKMI